MHAAYPPGCRRSRGRVRGSLSPAGGLVVHVTPSIYDGPHFRLGLLFATGSFVFPTPLDMFELWNGELADAFGLPVTVEAPRPPSEEAAADEDVEEPEQDVRAEEPTPPPESRAAR